MPPAERTVAAHAPRGALEQITGWGRTSPSPAQRWRAQDPSALATALRSGRIDGARGVIPRGLGRCYGDAAQRRDGVVIDARGMGGIELDPASGLVEAGAGVSLGELLATVIGSGWILPVVPGTQHVTVGGAIAADIHGKNHGTLGTFSRHVRALGLLTSAGEVLELSGGSGDPAFEATAGGMGLTGVILWARIALRPVSSAMVSVNTDRVLSLDEAFAVLDSSDGGEHRVAWLDLLAGAEPRGVVTRAAHLEEPPGSGSLRAELVSSRPLLTVPAWWPSGVLRAAAVRVFNGLRFRRFPTRERDRPEPYGAHMFPLDGLDAWPRLYGRSGLEQYQFVVPRGAEHVIRQVLAQLRAARVPSYLAVLKDFGEAAPGPLSFPAPGWTLALDVPADAPSLHDTLDRCDELVAGAGGRVYLAKDARLGPAMLEEMYPRLAEWRQTRDALDPAGLWHSDLATRTGLLDEGAP